MNRKFDWSPYEAQLRVLWGQGKSASQIAAALGNGITRNAVIGKVHRLKLNARAMRRTPRWPVPTRHSHKMPGDAVAGSGRKSATLRAASRAGHVAPPLPSGNMLLAFADGWNGQRGKVALLDLAPHHCRFPIDMADGSTLSCGDRREDDSLYCPAHAVRCFSKAEGRPAGTFKMQPMSGVV